jgi:hypothetical protein
LRNTYVEKDISIKILKNDIPDINGVSLSSFGIAVGDIYAADVYFCCNSGKHCTARIWTAEEEDQNIVLFAPEFELIED